MYVYTKLIFFLWLALQSIVNLKILYDFPTVVLFLCQCLSVPFVLTIFFLRGGISDSLIRTPCPSRLSLNSFIHLLTGESSLSISLISLLFHTPLFTLNQLFYERLSFKNIHNFNIFCVVSGYSLQRTYGLVVSTFYELWHPIGREQSRLANTKYSLFAAII